MKLIITLSWLIVLNIGNVAFATSMDASFNKREQYRGKTGLGNPDASAKFLDQNQDVSHLGGLNDTSLMDKGKEELRSSSQGKSLQDAEEKKLEAIERYKINSQNAWIKNSLAIEENPMTKAGGKGLSASEQTSSIQIKKTCTEGVDFNVDVGIELVLECEEVEVDGPLQLKSIDIPYAETSAESQGLWLNGRYTEGNLSLKKSGGGFSVPVHTFLNTPENLFQVHGLISQKIAEKGAITIPPQDIFIHSGIGTPPKRNVVYEGSLYISCAMDYYLIEEAIVKFHYNTQEKLKKLVEKDEYWQVVTEGTEKLAESNECYETERVCLKSGVKTFFDKYDVSRPCWYEKVSYRCTSEPKGGCDHLVKQSCQLQGSTCEYQIGSICLRWKREYLCGGKKKELFYSLADSPIYCLGGDCHKPTVEENQDFSNVAYLAALNEANKDCVKESTGLCKNPITVFPGQPDGCKKIVVGMIDCCSSMKGWGKNANLCKCSSGEKGLALKREKGLCHLVGTYCSKKDPVFGQCLEKKTNFCCFGSKLARIFHEQGRSQLGIGWGGASSPDCRSLTLDELKSLDFSKFDMEELFDALLSKGKSKMNKTFAMNLAQGEIPQIQKEHMTVNTAEKREIKRRKEEEAERQRLVKLEEERLAKLEAERLAKLEAERVEKERLARLEAQRQAQLRAQQEAAEAAQQKIRNRENLIRERDSTYRSLISATTHYNKYMGIIAEINNNPYNPQSDTGRYGRDPSSLPGYIKQAEEYKKLMNSLNGMLTNYNRALDQ